MAENWNFICINGHSNIFADKELPPEECATCGMDYDERCVISTQIDSLVLIYQSTDEEIKIPRTNQNSIIGREGLGAEVLRRILNHEGKPLMSRTHCSIFFKDQFVLIKDEQSANGTFVGEQKVACITPQILHHDQFVFLGKERFLVQFNYSGVSAETPISKESNKIETAKSNLPIEYRCRMCSRTYDEAHEICPNCDNYQTIQAVLS